MLASIDWTGVMVVALGFWAGMSLLIGGVAVLALGPRRLSAVLLPAGTAFVAGGLAAGVSIERTAAVAIATALVAAVAQRSWSSRDGRAARDGLPAWAGADGNRTGPAWSRTLADRRRARRRDDP